MKAKDLADILLQHPDIEVAFFSVCGLPRTVAKVIKCQIGEVDNRLSFDKMECLVLDDGGTVRKSWLQSINGELVPHNDKFIHDDTKSEK